MSSSSLLLPRNNKRTASAAAGTTKFEPTGNLMASLGSQKAKPDVRVDTSYAAARRVYKLPAIVDEDPMRVIDCVLERHNHGASPYTARALVSSSASARTDARLAAI
jgi:hypothetical protein